MQQALALPQEVRSRREALPTSTLHTGIRTLMFKVWFINFSIKRMMLILITATCRKVCDKVVFFCLAFVPKKSGFARRIVPHSANSPCRRSKFSTAEK